MGKFLLDEILEVQKSVLDNLNNISIVAISENQMQEVQILLTQTVNKALDMSLEAEARETNRMMDVYSPAIFDSFK
jgi:hypothetical protein